jgi:hypothetical protein
MRIVSYLFVAYCGICGVFVGCADVESGKDAGDLPENQESPDAIAPVIPNLQKVDSIAVAWYGNPPRAKFDVPEGYVNSFSEILKNARPFEGEQKKWPMCAILFVTSGSDTSQVNVCWMKRDDGTEAVVFRKNSANTSPYNVDGELSDN